MKYMISNRRDHLVYCESLDLPVETCKSLFSMRYNSLIQAWFFHNVDNGKIKKKLLSSKNTCTFDACYRPVIIPIFLYC